VLAAENQGTGLSLSDVLGVAGFGLALISLALNLWQQRPALTVVLLPVTVGAGTPGTTEYRESLAGLRIVAMTGSRQPVTLHDVRVVGRRTSPDRFETAVSAAVEVWAGRPETFEGPSMPYRIDSHDAAVWEIPVHKFRERIRTRVTEVRAVGQRYSPRRRLPFGRRSTLVEYHSEWLPIGPE